MGTGASTDSGSSRIRRTDHTTPRQHCGNPTLKGRCILRRMMDRSSIGGSSPDIHMFASGYAPLLWPKWSGLSPFGVTPARTPNLPPRLLGSVEEVQDGREGRGFPGVPGRRGGQPGIHRRTFQRDLVQPGLRIPLTARPKLFSQAVELGRRVIWLHTFGERFRRSKGGSPAGAAATPEGARRPRPQRRRHSGRRRFHAR